MRSLRALHRTPCVIVDDPELGYSLHDPGRLRIQSSEALARLRVFDVALSVPDQFSEIEFVVEDAGAASPIAVDRRGAQVRPCGPAACSALRAFATEAQLLVEVCDMLLVVREPVECLGDQYVEGAGPRVGKELLVSRAQVRGAAQGIVAIGCGQRPAFDLNPQLARANLILDRALTLILGRIIAARLDGKQVLHPIDYDRSPRRRGIPCSVRFWHTTTNAVGA